MNIQLSPIAYSRQIPADHLPPDAYLDPNCYTLDAAVQQSAIDTQADTPLIIQLLEHPRSTLALPGKIDLYGHDCLHALLNRGHSPADEAFILGFTMGNDTRSNGIYRLLYKLIASTIYPKKYRFSWKDFRAFDAGFSYGRSIQSKNLNRIDFSAYQNRSVTQVRQQFGISKPDKEYMP